MAILIWVVEFAKGSANDKIPLVNNYENLTKSFYIHTVFNHFIVNISVQRFRALV